LKSNHGTSELHRESRRKVEKAGRFQGLPPLLFGANNRGLTLGATTRPGSAVDTKSVPFHDVARKRVASIQPPNAPNFRRRVFLICTLPVIALLAVMLGGLYLQRWQQERRLQVNIEWRRVHENATAKLDAARDRLQADLAAGRITQAQWLEQIVPPQDAWSREIEAAADRLVASRPSAFIQIAGYFLLHGPPVLFLLHLVLLAVWWSVARRLLIDLHSRGYNWLGLPDALCMVMALRGKSWSAPPAHDYLLIPGHSEETGALIAFLKARGRRG